MKLALALAGLSATSAAAEALPVRLDDGAAWTVTMEHRRERERPGSETQSTRLATVSDAVWVRSGEHGRLTLTPKDIKLDGAAPQGLDPQNFLLGASVIEVDEALTPIRLVNWDELRGKIVAEVEKGSSDPKVRAELENMLNRLSDEQAAQVAARSWGMASLGQGADLEVGEDAAYKDVLPNPLGGPPIKSVGRFRLESVDKGAGRAVVVWNQTLDPASASESISQALQGMVARIAPERAEEARKAFEGARVTREDACRHEIDIPTGLAVNVLCTSESAVTVEGQTGVSRDRWTITQTRPQTPAKTN